MAQTRRVSSGTITAIAATRALALAATAYAETADNAANYDSLRTTVRVCPCRAACLQLCSRATILD